MGPIQWLAGKAMGWRERRRADKVRHLFDPDEETVRAGPAHWLGVSEDLGPGAGEGELVVTNRRLYFTCDDLDEQVCFERDEIVEVAVGPYEGHLCFVPCFEDNRVLVLAGGEMFLRSLAAEFSDKRPDSQPEQQEDQ